MRLVMDRGELHDDVARRVVERRARDAVVSVAERTEEQRGEEDGEPREARLNGQVSEREERRDDDVGARDAQRPEPKRDPCFAAFAPALLEIASVEELLGEGDEEQLRQQEVEEPGVPQRQGERAGVVERRLGRLGARPEPEVALLDRLAEVLRLDVDVARSSCREAHRDAPSVGALEGRGAALYAVEAPVDERLAVGVDAELPWPTFRGPFDEDALPVVEDVHVFGGDVSRLAEPPVGEAPVGAEIEVGLPGVRGVPGGAGECRLGDREPEVEGGQEEGDGDRAEPGAGA